MDTPVLRLVADDLRHALEDVDPAELTRTDGRGPGHALSTDGMTVRGGESPDDELLLEDSDTANRFVLPRSSLCLSATTMMVTLAASRLLVAGETTVALLASGDTALFHLTTLARHLPGVGHVSLTSTSPLGKEPQPDEWVLELLGEADIDLSVVETLDEATSGANLLITTGPGHDDLTHRHLTRGALLVNATGRDLPTDVVNHVDQIYVDDLGLLEHNRHRHFVTVHLRENGRDQPVPLMRTEGWHRQWATREQAHRVETDIRQVISGHHPGRSHPDDVLLFELLGVGELDFPLALLIHRAAQRRGLGTWIWPPTTNIGGDTAAQSKD